MEMNGQGGGRGRQNMADDRSLNELRRPHIMPTEMMIANLHPSIHMSIQYPPANQVINPAIDNHGRLHSRIQLQQHIQQTPIEMAHGLVQGYDQQMMYSQIANNFGNMSLANISLLQSSILSPNAPEFVPRGFPIDQSQGPNQSFSELNRQVLPEHTMPQLEFINNPIVHQIDNLVVNLTLKPFKFQETAAHITSIISNQIKNANLMQEIVTIIFEQGIGEENFRYSGARLCQYIDMNVKQGYNGPCFKDLLLKRCQDDFKCKEYYLQALPDRLRGFSLFLADLFIHLVSDSSKTIDSLHRALCNLLITLMTKPENDNLKTVVKVLKAAGNALDSNQCAEMDDVMFVLKDLTITASLTLEVKTQLLSLIELRASSWGRSSTSDSSTTSVQDVPLGTVYYEPDGQIKKVVLDENEDSYSDSDETQIHGPPLVEELEGEVAVAFEKFLEETQEK